MTASAYGFEGPIEWPLKPLDVPASDPDVGPFHTCQFNRDWLPYVLGVAGLLVEFRNWQADDFAGIELGSQKANNLLTQIATQVPVEPLPNWTVDASILTAGTITSFDQVFADPTIGIVRVYAGVVERDVILDEAPEILLRGRISGPTFVGGEWVEISIRDDQGAARVWTVVETDCFDATHTTSGLSATISLTGHAKSWDIIFDAPTGYAISVVIRDPWECGPA